MIDRHRSLIHILMSGLVGLVLGLFIAWWVWPVEWTNAPAGQPAPAAQIQAGETQVESGAPVAANISTFQDTLNRGLLLLAAALLVVGGVAIGYQLLSQSQKTALRRQPAASPDAREAAAPRGRPARPAFVSGGQDSRRLPGLSWIRGARPADEEANVDEPVFPSHSAAESPAGQSATGRQTASGTVRLRHRDTEAYRFSDENDDSPETEEWSDSDAEWADPAVEAESTVEREPDAAVYREEPVEFGEYAEESEGNLPDVAPALAEESEFDLDEEGENAAHLEGSWQATPTATSPADDQEFGTSDATIGPDQHAQPVVAELGAGPSTPVASEDMAAQRSQAVQTQTEPPSLEDVGTFEANYAFGIQSYDESFTVSSTDGSLLGACGMGINESLDRAAGDTDQVRLLEVWLYDRSAVRSVSQPLVSPGFDFSLLNDRADNGNAETFAPLELTPGLTCTLKSRDIVLECTVKSVTFLDGAKTPRPLRSVSASLVVRGIS